ncbi:ABC transporter substrate-binding protein [Bacillus luteolus]|uniref:ABC transporter substrate-binding protein n=1 Tax=Litchfieldia luteola TaxID=682179 RepID=A0ABR9QKY3_9BACI|nr:nickel ABC transporter substrate-binding protein [Cytobacillus luteolus]MBE4909161.1 ABC transporter substrate-binding protein [Cytobacillus luteolus]MBP1940386.1 peptide/nickel transport system substrate-binding protein [Cytobacillus luteolus]
MKFTNKTIFYLLVALLFAFAAGCSNDETKSVSENKDVANESSKTAEKSVTLLFSFASKTIDPHQDWMGVRAGIAETLVKVDENLEIQPWVAERWEQIDPTTWKFTIRDGVTFHDGTPVDGEAVKASFERLLSVNESIGSNLKIEAMVASGQDITFTTKEEYPAFLSELVHTNASIIKADAENMSEKPIATGPFEVVRFTPESEINLKRYDGYWDGAAKVDKVTIKFNSDGNVRALALQSGEADIAYHLPPEALAPIESREDLRVESVSSLRVHFLLYNANKPALQDVNVRKALDLLINRPVAVSEIMNGHATEASGPFNPTFAFAGEKAPEGYDPKRAELLLEEAGYEKNANGMLEKDGKSLELKLATYQGRPELPLMAQYLQAEAASLGIKIDIFTVEDIDSYLWEQQDEWDLVTYSNLTAPRGDGGYFLNVAYLPEGGLNPGQINIPKLNEITQQLNVTANLDERIELQKKAVEIIQTEVPQSFILHPHIIVGVNERIKNWQPGSEEYYLITNKMDVE